MSNKLAFSLEAVIVGDSSLLEKNSIECDTITSTSFVLVAGARARETEFSQNAVKALIIKSSSYPSGITYKIASTGGTEVVLDRMQAFCGPGQVSLLGLSLNVLYFYNTTGQDVTITMLIGKDSEISPM